MDAASPVGVGGQGREGSPVGVGATPPPAPPREGEGSRVEGVLDDGVDWGAVRRAYELSGEAVSAIRARFGLTPHQLRVVRVAEGWATRPAVARPGPLQGRKAVGSEALASRLSRLLAIGIAMLEMRIAEEGMTDQNARTLTELCRAEEIRMRSTRAKTAKSRETKIDDAGLEAADDAWYRAELKKRIHRVRAAHAEGRGAGRGGVDEQGAGG